MKNMSEEVKFQALHEHYRDTFRIIREEIKRRGKLMKIIFIVLMFGILFAFWPSELASALLQIFSARLGVELNANFFPLSSAIGIAIWFVLLSVVVRYMQTVVYLERQYEYIHRIEEELHGHYKSSSAAFTREGKSYLEEYPTFSNLTHLSYTKIFPFALIIIICLNTIGEWTPFPQTKLLLASSCINTAIAIYISILIFFYIEFMRQKK